MSAIPSLTLFTNYYYYYYYGFSYVEEKHVFSGAALSMEAFTPIVLLCEWKAPFYISTVFFFKERKSDGKIAMKSLKIPKIFIFCGCSLVIHLHTNYHRWYKYCRHKQSVTKLMTHKKLITKLSKRKVF